MVGRRNGTMTLSYLLRNDDDNAHASTHTTHTLKHSHTLTHIHTPHTNTESCATDKNPGPIDHPAGSSTHTHTQTPNKSLYTVGRRARTVRKTAASVRAHAKISVGLCLASVPSVLRHACAVFAQRARRSPRAPMRSAERFELGGEMGWGGGGVLRRLAG